MKTLKDLDRLLLCAGVDVDYVDANDLEDAAREWIKQININQYENTKLGKWGTATIDDLDINCGEYSCDNIVDWIRHFFNLEEDK